MLVRVNTWTLTASCIKVENPGVLPPELFLNVPRFKNPAPTRPVLRGHDAPALRGPGHAVFQPPEIVKYVSGLPSPEAGHSLPNLGILSAIALREYSDDGSLPLPDEAGVNSWCLRFAAVCFFYIRSKVKERLQERQGSKGLTFFSACPGTGFLM
jgi:hypothetical protein